MKNSNSLVSFDGIFGRCGDIDSFLGFAPASLLRRLSRADVLNEETGTGYQRPHNRAHSQDFRRYITMPNTSTIPLVFNVRKEESSFWKLEQFVGGRAKLFLNPDSRSLVIVDGQHRIGELDGVDIPMAFMVFVGLDLATEMGLFATINSKAKGITTSLTDFLQSRMIENIADAAPHLLVARMLNDDPNSPWFHMIRYGGETTSGMKRRTSLRMMQRCVQRLLRRIRKYQDCSADQCYRLVKDYWCAVRTAFPVEWNDPRHHLLTKGVGLYSMMLLLEEIISNREIFLFDEAAFVVPLAKLKDKIDWRADGMFSDAGGQKGAHLVFDRLKGAVCNESTAC